MTSPLPQSWSRAEVGVSGDEWAVLLGAGVVAVLGVIFLAGVVHDDVRRRRAHTRRSA